MRNLRIQSRENYNNLSVEYRIDFFGLCQFYPTISHSAGVLNKKHWWLSLCKWWIKLTCKHQWCKVGKEYMQGYFLGDSTTFYQNHKCSLCEKEAISSRVEHDYP